MYLHLLIVGERRGTDRRLREEADGWSRDVENAGAPT